MEIISRFLKYVSFDTQSDEKSASFPSAGKEKLLGAYLAQELKEIGLSDAHMDQWGYVYGHLPATAGQEDASTLGLIAHMDTSPDAPGANARPRRVAYEAGELLLNDCGVAIEEEILRAYRGQELIVTDGKTLLGADDKAGIAEIFSAMEFLVAHPEIAHGRIAVAITPDEEVGRGTEHFDLNGFDAQSAYTVDGGALGEIEYENFNAANACVSFKGINIHPGEGKNRMRNAILLANEFLNLMPPAETPAHTEGYEGFYHVNRIEGDESDATIYLLIRDHDKAAFELRKQNLAQMAEYLNQKYASDTVTLLIRDSYYNMKEKIEPHMELIDRAAEAMRICGVTPRVVPIRGGTDGAKLSYEGLPCPNLCTGGVNFHSVREFIPCAALEIMTKVLVELVRK